jgi:hypothetical protein
MCGKMAMSLLYKFSDVVKHVCYIGLGFNGFFMTGVTLMGGHYRTDIISSVGYLRLESVMPLVLCTVAYNIRGTGVILKVHQNSANPVEKW